MSDLIDRAKVQSELRAYLVHESSEIALNVEQIVAAIPATDAREKALREAVKAIRAAWEQDSDDVNKFPDEAEAAILALIDKSAPDAREKALLQRAAQLAYEVWDDPEALAKAILALIDEART